MHRIDSATASPTLPTPDAVGSPGYFSHGNVSAGVSYTVTTNDWGNAVQEEIVNVVLGAGETLDKTNNGQLLTSINTIAANVANASMLAGFYRYVTGSGGGGEFFERFPDGTIIQANSGTSSSSCNGDVITFPLAFPNNCWTVIAQESAPTGWTNCTIPTIFGTDTISGTGFKLYIARWVTTPAFVPGNAISYRYIAIGF
jgi:hypothetical protein